MQIIRIAKYAERTKNSPLMKRAVYTELDWITHTPHFGKYVRPYRRSYIFGKVV